VVVTMAASLTLLPALLGFAGSRVEVTRWRGLVAAALVAVALVGVGLKVQVLLVGIPLALVVLVASFAVAPLRREVPRRAPKPVRETWAYRWSRVIQHHPWISMLASASFLVVLALPVLGLRLGFSDQGNDPADTTTRKAYDLMADGFGPGFNGPFVIAAELPEKGDDEALQELRSELKGEEGVEAVTDVTLNPDESVGVFQLYPTTSPQSEDTTELLHRVRSDVIPPVEQATGAKVHVGGINAIFEDFGNAIADKLPLFIGVVVLLSALLLMVVFRSILVPLKAILMNLLSIGAAFGLIVAVFQWGWGASLIGVDATGPIISFFPIFLFSIIFGLSMDYEVFLMSRIHEEWEHSKDATESVTRGLALTGRVITAAAAIMVTVFAAFMIGDDRIIKLFGLGLASAVFIDAVIIRSVLVPAVMQLLGARAWWFPSWLDRILPRLHVEPAEGDPSPTGEFKAVEPAGAKPDG
jgi:RND superfamily putative drug exporter